MNTFTNNTRGAYASIPKERSDLPTHTPVDSPKPGTKANPIVIEDDLAPLGSASNPIVIYVDKEHCGHDKAEELDSDVDTEIMATPEFWENLTDECFPVPKDEGVVVGSTSVLTPTRLLGCENPEPRFFGQSSENHLHLDEKALKMAEGKFHVRDCHSSKNAPCENGAKGERDSEQSRKTDNISKAEELTIVHRVLETSLAASDAISQEPKDHKDSSDGFSFCEVRLKKRKRSMSSVF